jgi:uncharacterized protein (UPF0333 family)
MSFSLKKNSKMAGFTIIEGLLILVLVVLIVGVGAYVIHKKGKKTTAAASVSATNQAASPGSTSSIEQITQQDAQSESNIDGAADSQIQSNLNSSNGSTSNVGGAYNENNL